MSGPSTEDPTPTRVQTHEFRLYRSGWSEGFPWDDNQLWARGVRALFAADKPQVQILEPCYGSAASWYQVRLERLERASAEMGWVSWRVSLVIDSMTIGGPAGMPLSWYVGAPSDWPSGLARFPETIGPPDPRVRSTFPDGGPRGVWTLAVRRAS